MMIGKSGEESDPNFMGLSPEEVTFRLNNYDAATWAFADAPLDPERLQTVRETGQIIPSVEDNNLPLAVLGLVSEVSDSTVDIGVLERSALADTTDTKRDQQLCRLDVPTNTGPLWRNLQGVIIDLTILPQSERGATENGGRTIDAELLHVSGVEQPFASPRSELSSDWRGFMQGRVEEGSVPEGTWGISSAVGEETYFIDANFTTFDSDEWPNYPLPDDQIRVRAKGGPFYTFTEEAFLLAAGSTRQESRRQRQHDTEVYLATLNSPATPPHEARAAFANIIQTHTYSEWTPEGHRQTIQLPDDLWPQIVPAINALPGEDRPMLFFEFGGVTDTARLCTLYEEALICFDPKDILGLSRTGLVERLDAIAGGDLETIRLPRHLPKLFEQLDRVCSEGQEQVDRIDLAWLESCLKLGDSEIRPRASLELAKAFAIAYNRMRAKDPEQMAFAYSQRLNAINERLHALRNSGSGGTNELRYWLVMFTRR